MRITSNNNHCLHSLLPPPKKKDTKAPNSLRSRGQLPQIESNLFKNSFLADLFVHICRLVFLSWLQFVQCLCILFLFYLTVLFACMICFYYNVCDCHAFIKGNLLTYLLNRDRRAVSLLWWRELEFLFRIVSVLWAPSVASMFASLHNKISDVLLSRVGTFVVGAELTIVTTAPSDDGMYETQLQPAHTSAGMKIANSSGSRRATCAVRVSVSTPCHF